MLNVKDYGAMGDNSTDDRDAIQRAINDAAGKVDHTVFIPAGIYVIGTEFPEPLPDPPPKPNHPLVIPSKVRLIGEGAGQTTLRLPNNASQYAPWGSERLENSGVLVDGTNPADFANHLATLLINKGNVWWFGTDFNYSQVLLQPDIGIEPVLPNDDIEIAYMTLDGNNTSQPDIYNVTCHTSKGSAMFISAACALSQQSNAYLHDLELCNSADSGLDLRAGLDTFESGVTNSRFERLWVHHNGWAAVSINGEAQNLWFDSCTIEENTNQAVALTFS